MTITSTHGIVGASPSLRDLLDLVDTVAPTDSTVLIEGETGTGKDLVARAIHAASARRAQPFVKMNCAAIPAGLLESELFGHERGAFTGAVAPHAGRFEQAHRGSVFLDEIGEMPLELQPKLLRVLQEREFERLGSGRTVKTDTRLIAATNRDLRTQVEHGDFRADLFYRLNVFPIKVPSLRERPQDIPLLVRHFVAQFAARMSRPVLAITDETMAALITYRWPGNIRELQNVLERAVIVSRGPALRITSGDLRELQPPLTEGSGRQTLEDVERAHILKTLEATRGVVAGPKGAAAILGLNRSTLQFRMKRLGIVRTQASYGAIH